MSSIEEEGMNYGFPGRFKSRPWAVAKDHREEDQVLSVL